MAIRIIGTGGTIDGVDYDSKDKESKFWKTYIPQMLMQGRITDEVKLETVFQKDSRFITNDDRKALLARILECQEDRIVITHGTYSMAQTAQYLGDKTKAKTVVLVGSMVPYGEPNSDALFNLGFATASAQALPKGVYVAMNGRIFGWDNVRKKTDTGEFQTLR